MKHRYGEVQRVERLVHAEFVRDFSKTFKTEEELEQEDKIAQAAVNLFP